jgi:Domain of Unknown Function (DUF1259)
MKYPICFLVCALQLCLNANEVEKILEVKGTLIEPGKVFKITIPRAAVKVNVNGTVLDPFMGLTSWVAFVPTTENQSMVMGNLVLFQDEVNPVMSALLGSNLDVTALHTHFFYDNPKVYFMHFEGTGLEGDLAKGVKKWLDAVKDIRFKHPSPALSFGGHPVSALNTIRPTSLDIIFGKNGKNHNGIIKFDFSRTARVGQADLSTDMGVSSWIAFAGTNENALVNGTFAVTTDELQEVLKALRKGNIDIVAINQDMTKDSPRMVFVHFWGIGHAEVIAKTFKDALGLTDSALK